MGRSLWRAYLTVGVLVVVGYYALPLGLSRDAVYVLVGTSSAIAMCVGVRSYRPARPAAWYLMALGQLGWSIGDAVDSWYQDVAKVSEFPSPADGLYLSAYPVLAAALILLIRGRRLNRDIAGLLDSAIVTAGLGVVSWVLLVRPSLSGGGLTVATSVSLAYPCADIVLVALLIRLITTPGGRTPSFRLLLCAVGLLVLGDATSDLFSLHSMGTNSLDFIWLLSYVLWGTAALHPSMRTLSDPLPAANIPFSSRRLVVLAAATLMAPGALAVELAGRGRIDGWAIVVGSVVLFLLVVARMNLAMAQIVAANRQREQLQDDLAYQATHDSLTDLPNRAQALELIERALHRAQRTGAMVGLLFVDLDEFKLVNDTFGHSMGDEVLRTVARRMRQLVRFGDVVARLGGDEFVILLEPVDEQQSVVEIGQRLVELVSKPIATVAGREVLVGASVGLALALDGGTDAEQLLSQADAAVYRAKSLGRGRVEVFDEALRREIAERAAFEFGFSSGLHNGEFVLHYQPIVDVQTEELRGFEALIRWERPGVGLVDPAYFIPLAEASTLINELDCWVLREALSEFAGWTSSGAFGERDISMSVNISGRHFADPRIVHDVVSALRESGVDAERLILEITETVLVDDPMVVGHLEALRDLGVRIRIDDFGTGYNSVVQLQYLPVDGIKLDRSFVTSVHPAAPRLLVVLIQAAHAFDLPVIAEGVEEPAQLEALRAAGCEYAQGYLFARPMSAPEALTYLLQGHGRRLHTAQSREG